MTLVSRLTGRCTSCSKHGVVYHSETADALLCGRCIGEVLDTARGVSGLFEGSTWAEWAECHVDHRRWVSGCPLCGAGG